MALIGLRQGLLAAAGREKVLGRIEADVTDALMRTLRSLLWLKGQKEAMASNQVVMEMEKEVKRDLPGIRMALDSAQMPGWNEFKALYDDVCALGNMVDAW